MSATVLEHDTDTLDCWCEPTYWVPCDDCDDPQYRGAARVYLPGPPASPGCWKCERGLVRLDREAADATDQTLVVVHNDR